MNIMILGATGRTGRHLVDLALATGHSVTAPARDPSRLATHHPRLTAVRADVRDPAALTAAMPGHDAVVVSLGAPALRRTDVRQRGTENAIAAMRATGVRRLVCVSVLGASESRATLPFFLRRILVPTYLRWPYADHERQEAAVRASDLDWTLVRPPFLTDGPPTGAYSHGFTDVDGLALKVSRADLAAFILSELSRGEYTRAACAVSC